MCTVATDADCSSKASLVHSGPAEKLQPALSSSGAKKTLAVVKPEDIKAASSAVAACKLGLVDQLSSILESTSNVVNATDVEGRTCLHYASGYGHEECVDILLRHNASVSIRDSNGDTPLHFAAVHGHPMCAYTLAKTEPATCLVRNTRSQNPVEVAAACERREVLNAMLLSCAGDAGSVAVQAMKLLLSEGAVPDTWAPNGSSALMLAASADGTDALQVLLDAGASIELQDALGRSALMFAAGNGAAGALSTLLDAGACIAARDRRGRSALEYAAEGGEAKELLLQRLRELEDVAARLQEDLLASLDGDAKGQAASGKGIGASSKSKRKKSKSSRRRKAADKGAGVSGADGCGNVDAEGKEESVKELEKASIQLIVLKPAEALPVGSTPGETPGGVQAGAAAAPTSGITNSVAAGDTATQSSDDDSSDWHVVGAKPQRTTVGVSTKPVAAAEQATKKHQPSPSIPVPKAPATHTAPKTTTAAKAKDHLPTITATLAVSAAALPMPCTSPSTSQHPSPSRLSQSPGTSSCAEPSAQSRPATTKPPMPTPPKSSGLGLAATLKLPAQSTVLQRDALWPSKPQGMPLAFKAALLGKQRCSTAGFDHNEPAVEAAHPTVPIAPAGPVQEHAASSSSPVASGGAGPAAAAAAAGAAAGADGAAAAGNTIAAMAAASPDVSGCGAGASTTPTVATAAVKESERAHEVEVKALKQQIAALQVSQQHLRQRMQLMDLQHQQELSAVLEDAAQHQAEAVALAAQQERTRILAQLQVLGFGSDIVRALLEPVPTFDTISLLASSPLQSSPWTQPLCTNQSVAASSFGSTSTLRSQPLVVKAPVKAPAVSTSMTGTATSSFGDPLSSSPQLRSSSHPTTTVFGFDWPSLSLPGLASMNKAAKGSRSSKGSFTPLDSPQVPSTTIQGFDPPTPTLSGLSLFQSAFANDHTDSHGRKDAFSKWEAAVGGELAAASRSQPAAISTVGPHTPLHPGVRPASLVRDASRGSITSGTGLTESASNLSLSMSPLSCDDSPSPFSTHDWTSSTVSLFSQPAGSTGTKAGTGQPDLPQLPDSLDDDFSLRLTSVMEQPGHFTPFGCGHAKHPFIDPIKDTPLPESALVGNH